MGQIQDVSYLEMILSGTAILFLLALCLVIFFIVYQRRLLYQERRHQAAEEAHQLKLLQATIESQEKERDRIGRELHDGVGVMLSTIRMYLGHWNEESGSTNEKTYNRLDELLRETIEAIRHVSADLRPVVLETLGLAEAISDLINTITQASGIAINFEANYNHTLAQKDELNIYRIVQELLTNTIRHANASEVNITIHATAHVFQLTYRDNGVGLANKERSASSGLGLKNIESRVNALNGKLTIDSPDSGGLLITIRIEHHESN